MSLVPLEGLFDVGPRLLQRGDGLHPVPAVVALVVLELIDEPLEHVAHPLQVTRASRFPAGGFLGRWRGRGLRQRRRRRCERRGNASGRYEKVLAIHTSTSFDRI